MENEGKYFYIFLVFMIVCVSAIVVSDNMRNNAYNRGYIDGYWALEDDLNDINYRIVYDSEFIDVGDYVTTTKQFENTTGKHVDGVVIAIWNDEVAWIVNENEGHEEINIMWLREI